MSEYSTPPTSHRLIIHEPPLQVLPSLAVAIGLNEAIVLQQLHYWLRKAKPQEDGRPWVYNTYRQWQEQFPFWSIRTIQGIFLKLEQSGIVDATDDFNRESRDRTKWYTINYEHTNLYDHDANFAHSMRTQDLRGGDANFAHSSIEQRLHTETTPETNTESETNPDIFEVFWEKYPRKEGKEAARKAWAKIKPDHDLILTIGYALHEQVNNNWKGRDKQYIPLPASWLSGKRWEDEITPYTNGNSERPKPAYFDSKGGYTAEGLAAKARGEI